MNDTYKLIPDSEEIEMLSLLVLFSPSLPFFALSTGSKHFCATNYVDYKLIRYSILISHLNFLFSVLSPETTEYIVVVVYSGAIQDKRRIFNSTEEQILRCILTNSQLKFCVILYKNVTFVEKHCKIKRFPHGARQEFTLLTHSS